MTSPQILASDCTGVRVRRLEGLWLGEAYFPDGVTKTTARAASPGQAWLDLADSLAGRPSPSKPWASDVDALAHTLDALAQSMGWAVTLAYNPADEVMSGEPPPLGRDELDVVGTHAMAHNDLYGALISALEHAAALEADPQATALRTSNLWRLFEAVTERAQQRVLRSAIDLGLLDVSIGSISELADGGKVLQGIAQMRPVKIAPGGVAEDWAVAVAQRWASNRRRHAEHRMRSTRLANAEIIAAAGLM
ncbi:hypothetical protein [Phenylobacterium conjunctum]|uniref:Uncharacterized protein n=1 Tax=Phenylobacterium conjunctum TaxID=1298959 RepID=A0ABW3T3F8_9CAUL